MKIFTNEQSDLIKCLECRLVGQPPKFNLKPPPELSDDLLEQLNLNKNDLLKFKKCISLKSNQLFNSNEIQTESASASLATTATTSLLPFTLTSTQSFYIFMICLIVFLLVLIIAFIFLIKLYRIKKQLESANNITNSKSTSDLIKNNRQQIFNCLSSSLTSSSASSTTSSNTINSNLILTPTLFSQQQQQTKKSTNNEQFPIFYNQLFTFNPQVQTNNINNNKQIIANDEYAEINSQTYKFEIYNQYDPNNNRSVLNSNSVSSIESNSLAPLIHNSRTLLANQNGLFYLNPTVINNNNNNNNNINTFKSNLHYVR
jgi:hypothetical protein